MSDLAKGLAATISNEPTIVVQVEVDEYTAFLMEIV
jgi:hypothetical protein